ATYSLVSESQSSTWSTNIFATCPSVSDDGRWVAYETIGSSDVLPTDTGQLLLTDMNSGVTVSLQTIHGSGYCPVGSPDGSVVVFESDAGSGPNSHLFGSPHFSDIGEYVTATGVVTNLTEQWPASNNSAPNISADGSTVSFFPTFDVCTTCYDSLATL